METILNFFKRIKEIFIKPSLFFESLKYEEGFGTALLFYFIIILIVTLFDLIVAYTFFDKYIEFLSKLFNYPLQGLISFPKLYSEAIKGLVGDLIFVFIWAGILHIWLKIFGGQASYQKSFQLYVYSHTPAILLSFIPFLGIFSWIWTVTLLIIGSQRTHNIEKNKAILIITIPYIILVILSWVLTIFYIQFIRNLTSLVK